MVSTLLVPPRFVPTLTTVVELEPARTGIDAPVAAPTASDAPNHAQVALLSEPEAFGFEEQLVHRVLQRIDLSLEERFGDTVRLAVQQQLDAMLPRLRDHIERLLRDGVVEALAQEFSENTGSTPTSEPGALG